MSEGFTINRTSQAELAIIRLDGYLDAHTAPELETAIQSEMDSQRYCIIVDCEKLRYISSAGLGVFMSFIDEVRENGGDIKICSLSAELKEILSIVNFLEIFQILDDLPTALNSFSA